MSEGRHDDRCPTCGRFVPADGEGFYDLPPGGRQNHDYVIVYCNERCADRKKPAARYEDDPNEEGNPMTRSIGDFDGGRIAELGRKAARRDHLRRRPRDEQTARWWAPDFREGYDSERERLGGCAPDAHDYRPDRVTAESGDVIRRLRPLGALIEICSRCGVFRDRPR